MKQDSDKIAKIFTITRAQIYAVASYEFQLSHAQEITLIPTNVPRIAGEKLIRSKKLI